MAGGIFGARHGPSKLPADALGRLEDRTRIEDTARTLHTPSRWADDRTVTPPSQEWFSKGGSHVPRFLPLGRAIAGRGDSQRKQPRRGGALPSRERALSAPAARRGATTLRGDAQT